MQKNLSCVFVVVFFSWHAVAVAVSSVPLEARDPFALASRQFFLPLFLPYLRTFSQWQQWRLFAPDPLREVSSYRIERKEGETWLTIGEINGQTLPWWRRAKEMAILRRIETTGTQGSTAMELRYLEAMCALFSLPEQTPLRFVTVNHTIPQDPDKTSVSFFRDLAAHPRVRIGTAIICPSSPS